MIRFHTVLDPVFILVSITEILQIMLITFANSLDSDQDRQNVGPDLNLNRLTL